MSTEIFISYSHEDAGYLEEDSLLGHLKSLEKDGAQFSYDKQINVGEDWDAFIKSKIALADIAVVLISQTFLRSKYIQDDEIKPFLRRAREEGLIIFPVILSAAAWEQEEWLRSRQFIPTDDQNIEEHFWEPPGKRKGIFKKVADALRIQVQKVEKTKQDGGASPEKAMESFSKTVNTANRLYPQVESFHRDEPEAHREYGIIYEGKGDHIEAKNRGHQTTLTPADLEKLSERQLRHISIFQEELEESYDRWEVLYQKRRGERPNVSVETVDAMRRVVAEMKDSLDRVFAFLKAAGLQIDDHYYLFQSIIEDESRKAPKPSGV